MFDRLMNLKYELVTEATKDIGSNNISFSFLFVRHRNSQRAKCAEGVIPWYILLDLDSTAYFNQ